MTTFTYDRRMMAWFGNESVMVPDQVAEQQYMYDAARKWFPAIRTSGTVYVKLDGKAYGLGSGGTGDMKVTAK